MKKILFVAFAATLLAAGCQKTEIINRVGDAMTFSTEMGKLTKSANPDATNDGYVNLDAQNFKVWAYYAYTDALNSVDFGTNYDGMKGLDVGYVYNAETKEASCETEKEYYWPGTGKDLDFFAVSTEQTWADNHTIEGTGTAPESGVYVTLNNLTGAEGAEVYPETREITVHNYVVNNANPNDDLMVADFVRQNQDENSKAVNLNFHHTLSKVEFLFKTKTPTADEAPLRVLVQSVSVTGLNNEGTLTVKASYPDTERPAKEENVEYVDAIVYPVNFDWGTTTGDVTFNDDYVTPYTEWTWGTGTDASSKIELVNGTEIDPLNLTEGQTFDNTALLLDDEAEVFTTWLMMPQSVEGKTVTVTYIINSRQFTSVFALDKNLNEKRWAVNQHIKYTVTLTPNVISFTPTVEDWTVPSTDIEHGN